MKSRCDDHDEDVVVRGYGGSGLDCSTDNHLDDYIEHALPLREPESEERYHAERVEMRQRSWY